MCAESSLRLSTKDSREIPEAAYRPDINKQPTPKKKRSRRPRQTRRFLSGMLEAHAMALDRRDDATSKVGPGSSSTMM